MPTEITALLGNIIAQLPLVALVSYLWYNDRKDKMKDIAFLRSENKKQEEILERFVKSMDKLAVSHFPGTEKAEAQATDKMIEATTEKANTAMNKFENSLRELNDIIQRRRNEEDKPNDKKMAARAD